MAVSYRLEMLSTLENPTVLRDTIKRNTLKAAAECLGELRRFTSGVASREVLEGIAGSCCQAGWRLGRYRTLVTNE